MAKKVRTLIRSTDGTPMPYNVVLAVALDKIQEASEAGTGVRLTGEEVRSLDWCIIREDGGYDTALFRDGSYSELGLPTNSGEPSNG